MSAYDGLGWFYDKYWGRLSRKTLAALHPLLLAGLPRGARVLDVSCGTGHLASVLSQRGLKVFGIDSSPDMIRFAKRNAPQAEFFVADARNFEFSEPFDAVVSTGDSMNHHLSARDFAAVLRSVIAALRPGGALVFDMNMARAFATEWRKSWTQAGSDHLMYIRGRYNKTEKLGSTEITLFRWSGGWVRHDLKLQQRCYTEAEVRKLLREAGFAGISVHSARSLSVRGQWSVGRAFFRAASPARSAQNVIPSTPVGQAVSPADCRARKALAGETACPTRLTST